MIRVMRSSFPLLLSLLFSAIAGLTIQRYLFDLRSLDPVYGQLHFYPDTARPLPGYAGLLCGFALFTVLPLRHGNFSALAAFNRSWLPLLLTLPLLAFKTAAFLPLLLILLCWSWSFYRLGRNAAAEPSPPPALFPPPKTGLLPVCLLLAAGVAWSCYMQFHAYRALYLLYHDWGEYATDYLKLIREPDRSLIHYFVTGGHWNPLMTNVMTLALRIFPAPETIFFLNSLLIYSLVPLIYWFARTLKLPVATALFFALAVLLNPVVSNQSLSLFYGYHPINALPSLLTLFFISKKRGNRAGMLLFFLLTLLVQETVTVLWFGYALLLIAQKRWKSGLILAAGMVLLFLLLSKFVIPAAAETTAYTQMFHYHQLGDSIREVLLSPFLRPRVFWSTLFALNNFDFLLCLTLPFFFLLLTRPLLLLPTLPLLAGVCLQSTRDVQNVVLQYGVDLNIILILAAMCNCARLFKMNSRRHLCGALAAALFCVPALYFFTGKAPKYGKYSFEPIAQLPEAGKVVNFLKSHMPPGSPVQASARIRSQLVFDYRSRKLGSPFVPGEYLLVDLFDGCMSRRELEEIRFRIASDPRIRPVTFAHWYNHHYALFKVENEIQKPAELPFLRQMPPEEFGTRGLPVPIDSPAFSARLDTTRQGKFLRIRLDSPIGHDVDLHIYHGNSHQEITFAHGLRPAYRCPAGTVFLVPLPQLHDADIPTLRIEAFPREGSAESDRLRASLPSRSRP